jgi:hypothetical protein
MFTFIGAGGWSAHSFTPWAGPPVSLRAFLLEWVRRSPKTGMWRSLGKDGTQMEVQVRRKDCAALNKQSFGSNAIQFPDMRNVVHICARPLALWFWYGRREYR